MADTALIWQETGAWVGIVSPGAFGAAGEGVTIRPREGLALASLIVPAKDMAAFGKLVKQQLGFVLPLAGKTAGKNGNNLLWSGPGQYLLVCESRSGFVELCASLGSLAAVSGQSDSRAVLRASGPMVKKALAKGCMIDLDDAVFPVGSVASTSIAHMGVQLAHVSEGVYDLYVARSMAGSFWSWLSGSVAEFGGVVEA